MTDTRASASETPIRVRYAETDAMGVVHHSVYAIWLEAGRGDWLRQRGSSYADLEASGHVRPVTELAVRFIAPARYDDVVTVRTWATEIRSRMIRFEYEVVEAGGRVLVEARTTHLCTTRAGQAARLPERFRLAVG